MIYRYAIKIQLRIVIVGSFSQTDEAEMASGRFRVAFSKVKTRLNYRKPIYPYKNYENIDLPIWSIKIYKKTMYV